jgi:hypothetical protein
MLWRGGLRNRRADGQDGECRGEPATELVHGKHPRTPRLALKKSRRDRDVVRRAQQGDEPVGGLGRQNGPIAAFANLDLAAIGAHAPSVAPRTLVAAH